MVKRAVVSHSHHPIVVLPDLAEAEFLVEPALVRGCSRWQSTCCNAWCSFAVSPSIAAVETACDNCTRRGLKYWRSSGKFPGKSGIARAWPRIANLHLACFVSTPEPGS